MNDYTFWAEETAVRDVLLEIGGARLGFGDDRPVSVRMFDRSGSCIFQVETLSLQASSLRLHFETFDTGITPTALRAAALVRTSDFEFNSSELVYVSLSVRPDVDGATYGYDFIVADGEILFAE